MKEIEISQRVRRMIRSAGGLNFRDTGRPSVDPGMWVIPIEQDLYDRITALMFEGEDFSDTIERLFAEKNGSVQ